MKKRGVLCIITAVVIGCAAAVFLMNKPQKIQVKGSHLPGGNRIEAKLRISDSLTALSGEMDITWYNHTGKDQQQILLLIRANTVYESNLRVLSASVNGESRYPHMDSDTAVLRLACDWPMEQEVQVHLTFEMSLDADEEFILSNGNGKALLCALPMPALFRDGAWNVEIAEPITEPVTCDAFASRVEILMPEQVLAVSGGVPVLWEEPNGTGRWTCAFEQETARDLSVLLVDGGMAVQTDVDGILLTAVGENAQQARGLAETAEKALRRFKKIGYIPTFSGIIIGKTGIKGGYSLSGMLLCEQGLGTESEIEQMISLFGRQLFGVFTGIDLDTEPWLSYSAASYLELMAYEVEYGRDAYEGRYRNEIEPSTRLTRAHGVQIGSESSAFGSRTELLQVLCDEGSVMLTGIGEMMGGQQLTDILLRFAAGHAGQRVSASDLLDAIWQATGENWEGYILDWLQM